MMLCDVMLICYVMLCYVILCYFMYVCMHACVYVYIYIFSQLAQEMPELRRYRPPGPRRTAWPPSGQTGPSPASVPPVHGARLRPRPPVPPQHVHDMLGIERAPAAAAAAYSLLQPAAADERTPAAAAAAYLPLQTAAADQPQGVGSEFDLIELLLKNIGEGKNSVADSARTAAAAQAYTRAHGGQPADDIKKLAAMADAHGHGERMLHAWLEKASWRAMLPALYQFDVPKRRHGVQAGEVSSMQHAAILPHEMFATMYAHAKPVFENILTGGGENLQKWWAAEAEWAAKAENNSRCTWFTHHPAIQGAPAEKRVPIGIHGDDAGVQGQESVTVLTWGSVAVEGPTLDTRLIFCMLKESEAVKPASLHKVFEVLTWSLTALAAGIFPAEDETGQAFGPDYYPARAAKAGKPLTSEGHRGCWAEMRGDWKFLHESLHTRAYYGANECCHFCAAAKSGPERLWYTNFRIGSDLRATRVTSKGWRTAAEADPGPVSPLLKIPGFCIWRVHFDIMHTLDLGVLTHVLPSALTELTAAADVFTGETRDDRLNEATKSYREWCKKENIESVAKYFGKRWCQGPYPVIGQFQAKAAAIRSMVYWFKEICEMAAAKNMAPANALHCRLRACMFNAFVEADEIQRRSGRHLSQEAQAKLAAAMERALCAYNALAVEAINAGVRLWRFIPKHHALTHIAYDNGGTNPRKVSCYLDEDMVGRMKRIYVMCHGHTAPYTSLKRYIILCGLRWRRVVEPAAAVAPSRVARRPRSGWKRSSRPY